MLRNYLTTALRNLKKHKGYAFINITGLAVGLACAILILFYILSEVDYDRYHENADRIVRVALEANVSEAHISAPVTNTPTGPALVKDFPEVQETVRILSRPKLSVTIDGKHYFENRAAYVDDSVFRVFSFPLVRGDPETALDRAYTVVLTESAAARYFGDEDPLGRVLRINNQHDFTVTGLMADMPRRSHFIFNILFSMETHFALNPHTRDNWYNFNLATYLLLAEGTDPADVEAKLPLFVDRYMGTVLAALGGEVSYFLQPLTRIHLYSHLQNELGPNGDIQYLYIFAAAAIFILIIAGINFINLSTARSAGRAREVSLRKVVGAERRALIRQFLGESLVYSLLAMAAALLLTRLFLPVFAGISGIPLDATSAQWIRLIPAFLLLTLIVGLGAGLYPAFFLSAFSPVSLLRGGAASARSNSRFRNLLVVFQFTISVFLLIGTGVIRGQLHFMQRKNLGFDRGNILFAPVRGRGYQASMESIKARLESLPQVADVAASGYVPGEDPNIQVYLPEGFNEKQMQPMATFCADADYLPLMGMEIVAGRNFSREFPSDPQHAVIINQAAARKLGWENPVGKIIREPDRDPSKFESFTVVGVVKDFHLVSLHRAIGPVCIHNQPEYLSVISIRLRPGDPAAALSAIKDKWREIDPQEPLDYVFLDNFFDAQYRSEKRLRGIFGGFTLIAVLIACLGLFGTASFTAERRIKEIGIRKVLGATIGGLILAISRDFLKLVVIANLIAWPLAYFVLSRWLQVFAYRIRPGIGLFLFTGLLALGIAGATIAYQSVKTALADPVKAIKYE